MNSLIALPTDSFELDTQTFARPVRRDALPTALCHYGESEFHMSLLNDYQRRLPELTGCKPFSESALRDIERRGGG